MSVLQTEGLGFVYPDGTRALEGVDLRIVPGEAVAIIGQNGSGKSTLVRHFNGLLRATQGRVLLDGLDVAGRHVAELARTVGITFQNPDRQIFARRVREEVAFGPRNLGASGAELEARVRGALEAVALLAHADVNPYDLGYSQRKLLSLASVLAMQTPVVVLDEPTTGQDARGIARVREIVAALTAEGRTVVATSHDMHFVAETFPRIVVMRAGRIVLDATPTEVYAERNWELLATTFLQPTWAAQVGAREGIGDTPTDASVVAALRLREERAPQA